LEVGGRSVKEVSIHTTEHKNRGMLGQTREYYLKTEEDYRTMIQVWERTKIVADQAACAAFDHATGPAGFPVLLLGLSPIHRIMLEYAGYESFYLHQADFPDLVAELCRIIEAKYEDFWPAVVCCPMGLILHDAHWSSQMTPPNLFEHSFLPYVQRFTRAMHAAGKKCGFHADADLTGLLDLILETGMDIAESFACAPLVPLTLQEARRAWGNRMVIWGGFPSVLLEVSASQQAFKEYLDQYIEQISDGSGIIAGVSDNVMPGALWPRIVELAERVVSIVPSGKRN